MEVYVNLLLTSKVRAAVAKPGQTFPDIRKELPNKSTIPCNHELQDSSNQHNIQQLLQGSHYWRHSRQVAHVTQSMPVRQPQTTPVPAERTVASSSLSVSDFKCAVGHSLFFVQQATCTWAMSWNLEALVPSVLQPIGLGLPGTGCVDFCGDFVSAEPTTFVRGHFQLKNCTSHVLSKQQSRVLRLEGAFFDICGGHPKIQKSPVQLSRSSLSRATRRPVPGKPSLGLIRSQVCRKLPTWRGNDQWICGISRTACTRKKVHPKK
jgi:hypothetical protein